MLLTWGDCILRTTALAQVFRTLSSSRARNWLSHPELPNLEEVRKWSKAKRRPARWLFKGVVIGAFTYEGAERGNPACGVSKSLQLEGFTLQGITSFGFQFLPISLWRGVGEKWI